MKFLQTLAQAPLPLTVADRTHIDLLRRLDAANYIKAFIPDPHVDCDDRERQDPAVVLEITARGRTALHASNARELGASNPELRTPERPREAAPAESHLRWVFGGARRSHS